MKPKYKNLKELSEAFRSGELDDSFYLMIDKGGNCLTLSEKIPKGEEWDEERADERYERCRSLFDREEDSSVEELLLIAGIPFEHC